MKNIKIAFATFALATSISLLVSSCQKDSLNTSTDEPGMFTKEFSVTDKSGKNSVVIRLSSADESLLMAADYSKVIELEPIFVAPMAENMASETSQEEFAQDDAGLHLEIVSRKLEKGAIGLKLRFNTQLGNAAQDRTLYPAPKTYTTPDNHIQVLAYIGCHRVKYYKKATSSSSWVLLGNYTNICPGYGSLGWAIPSYRLKAEVTKMVSSANVWVDIISW